MPQQYKIDKVSSLKDNFEKSKNFIFTDFRGLTVEKITELRNTLRKLNSKYVIMKNSYIRILAKTKGIDDLKDNAVGPTAVAFVNDEVAEVTKSLVEFTKTSSLKVKGGWIDNNLLNAEQLDALSKLPSKIQLIAMLMSTMNATTQKFVYACNDVIGRFVRVVNAVAEQKKS